MFIPRHVSVARKGFKGPKLFLREVFKSSPHPGNGPVKREFWSFSRLTPADRVARAEQTLFLLDLEDEAKIHLQFLRTAQSVPELHRDSSYLRNAIRRYEDIWIPLLRSTQAERLLVVAPLDVDYVWHCHQLHPIDHLKYLESNYIQAEFSRRIQPEDPDDFQEMLSRTQDLWERLTDEPFIVTPDDKDKLFSMGSSRLFELCLRKGNFYKHFEHICWEDEAYLQLAVKRYKMFLTLMESYRNEFLTPTYQIDLIWHTHMRHPHLYRLDTGRIFSDVLNHSDEETDRSPGSKLAKGWETTKRLWEGYYGEPYQTCTECFSGVMNTPRTSGKYMNCACGGAHNLCSSCG